MDEIFALDPGRIKALMDAVEAGGETDWVRFARLTGTDEAAVKKAWERGRIPCVTGGAIPVREGIVALVSCGGLRKKGKPIPGFLLDADARSRELLGLPPRDDGTGAVEADGAPSEVAAWKLKYLKAQTAARTAAAQAAQMKNDLERGLLVRKAEVELDAAETATNIAQALSRLPERAAGMCVGCTAEEIAQILRREISLALDAIQASAFTGDWGGGVL